MNSFLQNLNNSHPLKSFYWIEDGACFTVVVPTSFPDQKGVQMALAAGGKPGNCPGPYTSSVFQDTVLQGYVNGAGSTRFFVDQAPGVTINREAVHKINWAAITGAANLFDLLKADVPKGLMMI